MKIFIGILLGLLCFSSVFMSISDAEEVVFTAEENYNHFRYSFSPKEFFILAQHAAIWLAQMCEQGETSCNTGIDEFMKPQSEWNTMDGFHPQFIIDDFEKSEVVAHPNPALHKLIGIPNLGIQIKDHNGKLWIMELADKYQAYPKRPICVWGHQYSTWLKSITKMDDLFSLLNVIVEVPGTPYQIQGTMPYQADSTEDMDAVVADIEHYTEQWLIDDWNSVLSTP